MAAREPRLHGTPRPEAVCYAALAEADAGRALNVEVADKWRDAVAAADRTVEPWPQAYARLRLAAAVLRSGAPRSEAAEVLAGAHRIAAGMGAAPLVREAEALAAAYRLSLGTAPAGEEDPLARFGLTQREVEVLGLVAAGR